MTETKPAPSPSRRKESKPESRPLIPATQGNSNEMRAEMNRVRLRISERLKESQSTVASLTTFNEIVISPLVENWTKFKDQILKEHSIKLRFMSVSPRASVIALKESPRRARAARATRSSIAFMSIRASRLLRPRVSSRLC